MNTHTDFTALDLATVFEDLIDPDDTDDTPARVPPVDRLPVATIPLPPAFSPYHTLRTAEAQASIVALLGADRIGDSVRLLNVAGEFGLPAGKDKKPHKDWKHNVFTHNCVTLAAARLYAEHGFRVMDLHGFHDDGVSSFPARGDDAVKNPRGAKWPERASCDAREIDAFWTGEGKYPADNEGVRRDYAGRRQPRNVGIATGHGFFVLDLDGTAGAEWLTAHTARLPVSMTSITGSGGTHIYFKLPDGVSVQNSVCIIAAGVDIRGAGGFVVVPPSIHPTGNYYRWAEGRAPGQVEMADAPEWLIQEVINAAGKSGTRPKGKTRRPGAVAPGPRPDYGPDRPQGFEAWLDSVGDGEGLRGLDGPIYSAACAWFADHGAEADAQEVQALILAAVKRAPVDPAKKARVSRYTSESYLSGRIAQAQAYILAQEDGEEDEPGEGPEDQPEHGDAENAAEGAEIPRAGGEFEDRAVWLHGYRARHGKFGYNSKEKGFIALCGEFDVVGRSSNADGTEASGRIISFINENGKRVERTILMADLVNDARAVVARLANAGLPIFAYDKDQSSLWNLLRSITPQRLVPTVSAPGWIRGDDGAVLGYLAPTGEYIRAVDSAPAVRILETSRVEVVKPRGTLAGWQLAADAAIHQADQNPHWLLTLIAGFAGPLLGLIGAEPRGFALSGRTSKGKSIAQRLGASVWASPAPERVFCSP